MKFWQLINPQTGEQLSGLQELPENWGPIFGMHNVKDRLGDLSWLGIKDRAWIEVEAPELAMDQKSIVDQQIEQLLKETEPMVSEQNAAITKGQWQAWVDYRKKLQELHLHPDYPNKMPWPNKPE